MLATMALAMTPMAEPQPAVLIQHVEMPQLVIEAVQPKSAADEAVSSYHNLKESLAISHTAMAEWLGVKRRTLYNWLDQPEKSRFGGQIENRIFSLIELTREMELEHIPFLQKVAFSPIHGDPNFGKAILEGSDSNQLVDWYDKTFSRFEVCRKASQKLSV